MLPKKNRADKKTIRKIFKEGGFVSSPSLNFKYVLNTDKKNSRISFVVPKSLIKSAVERNLLRRRGYSALTKQIKNFSTGLVGAFVFRKPENSILILENEIKTILHKIH